MTSTVERPFGVFQKALIVTGTAGAFAAALFLVHVSGDTQIAMTLSPPTLEEGLVGHWTFDGKDMPQGQVNDRSGQGNHGSARNMSTTTMRVAGVLGQALEFDGVNDYVDISAVSNDLDVSQGTASAWLYRAFEDSDTSSPTVFSMGELGTNSIIELYYEIEDSSFYCYYKWGGVGQFKVVKISIANVPKNHWSHIACTWDITNDQFKVYLNGAQFGATQTGLTEISGTPDEGYISSSIITPGSDSFVKGAVDDVRIYNRALSLDEIKHLYQLGATTKIATTPEPPPLSGAAGGLVGHWTFNGKDMPSGQVNDRSGQGNHGSMVSMSSSTAYVAGVLGQGLYFNKTDGEYINTGNAEALSEDPVTYTYSVWVRPDADDTSNSAIFSNMESPWDNGILIRQNTTDARLQVYIAATSPQLTVTTVNYEIHHPTHIDTIQGAAVRPPLVCCRLQ